jgi:integrase
MSDEQDRRLKRSAMRARGGVELHRGRYRVRATVDGERVTLATFDTAEEAEWFRSSAGAILAAPSTSPTVSRYARTWTKDRERTHRDDDDVRKFISAHLEDSKLGVLRIDQVTERDVREWAREFAREPVKRSGEPRSQSTIRNACSKLRALFAHALDAGEIRTDPAASLKVPRAARSATERVEEETLYLTEQEIARVLALPLRIDQRTAFVVGVFAGLRAGELAGLRWEDVRVGDDEQPEVIVRRSRRGATKGNRVERVPLLPPAVDALRRLRAESGAKAVSRSLVLPGRRGGTHCVGYDWGWSNGACFVGMREAAGIRKAITWHAATRHTCATHLLLGTWAPAHLPRALRIEEVSRWLRHRSIGVTQRYAHLSADGLAAITRPVSVPVSVPTENDDPPNPLKSLAPPARIERATNGLGNLRPAFEIAPENGAGDRSGDRNQNDLAKRVLEAVRDHSPFAMMLAVELAEAVLLEAEPVLELRLVNAPKRRS